MNSKINFIIVALLFLPILAFAAEATSKCQNLVCIPGLEEEMDIGKYVNTLYIMSISVAAMIAVIKIIISGFRYMMTGLIGSKEEAVTDIRGALLGLIIIMGAVLLLEYINPQLTKSSIQLEPIKRTESTGRAQNNSNLDPAPPRTYSRIQIMPCTIQRPYDCGPAIERCDGEGGLVKTSITTETRSIECGFE